MDRSPLARRHVPLADELRCNRELWQVWATFLIVTPESAGKYEYVVTYEVYKVNVLLFLFCGPQFYHVMEYSECTSFGIIIVWVDYNSLF